VTVGTVILGHDMQKGDLDQQRVVVRRSIGRKGG